MFDLVALLEFAREQNASDVFLEPTFVPHIKTQGKIKPVESEAIESSDILFKSIYPLLNTKDQARLKETETGSLIFVCALDIQEVGRFRLTLFQHQRGFCAAMRVCSLIRSPNSLGLAIELEALILRPGLILISGQSGSGRTSTVNALLNHVNKHDSKHFITFSEVIENVHTRGQSLIEQREEKLSYQNIEHVMGLLRSASVDGVIVDDELDIQSLRALMGLVDLGKTVVLVLPGRDVNQTLSRFINRFSGQDREPNAHMLADTLSAVFCQKLDYKEDGLSLQYHLLLNKDGNEALIRALDFRKLVPIKRMSASKEG